MILGKSQRDRDVTQVASIAITHEGKLLWLQRADNGLLTMPGGHLNPGEEPIEGAIREAREETNLDIPRNEIEFLGDELTSSGLQVFAFHVEVDDVDRISNLQDPDAEAARFFWLDEMPPPGQHHVPLGSNVTLRLLGLTESEEDLNKSDMQKEWRATDGLRLPHFTNPARKEWDKKYHESLVEFFGNGDAKKLKAVRVPVSDQMSGHTPRFPAGPGGRDRRTFYSRMVAGGDRLPPIVVRRNGDGWHVVDGNARLEAALKYKLKDLDAYEIVD